MQPLDFMCNSDFGCKAAKDGLPIEAAGKSAWQFLNKTNDPRLSMLRKFAQAVECSVKSLF